MISFETKDRRFKLRATAVDQHDCVDLLYRPLADALRALPAGWVNAGKDDAAAAVRYGRRD